LNGSNGTFSFGSFEVRTRSREVYKHGIKLKLRPQPFQILEELLSRPGELVTREELREKLWSSETFVDFEQSLNTSVKELRAALGDSATEPRYVETVPRLGYRFIARGEVVERATPEGSPTLSAATGRTVPAEVQRKKGGMRRWLWVVAPLVAALLVLVFVWPASVPRVVRVSQVTHIAHVEAWGRANTDGARIFFLTKEADGWRLMQVPASGGEPQPFPAPLKSTRILDISPDRSEFLAQTFKAPNWDMEFWTLPVVGGSASRLADLTGNDGVFSPDGQKIAYSRVDGIYICTRNGNDVHKIVSLPPISWSLAWSPDGQVLRFSLEDPKKTNVSLWEVSIDGRNLHRLLPGWNEGNPECCGRWSRDGRYYFFVSTKGELTSEGIESIWVRREKRRFPFWSKPGPPIRLTAGPITFGNISLSMDGHRLFVPGDTYEQRELLRPTKDKTRFLTMLPTRDVYAASLSPSGDWLAVVLSGWTLWRSRLDGNERTQLTTQFPGWADKPSWSPDGTRIVFQGRQEGKPSNIYVVSADGGTSEELFPSDRMREAPDWSHDGESIAYFTPRLNEEAPKEDSGIFVLDLKTRKQTRVPESEGMMDPRLSFDGRYLGALSEDREKLMAFDFQSHTWKEIARGKFLSHLDRTRDAKYFYFQDVFEKGEPVYRVRVGDWKGERVMSFESLLESDVVRCSFIGISPDGSPMVLAIRGGYDIYALDLDLP
jgi:DNA-binding winged helix-turn-helix (wHTH) protein/dipeptidyl aminopeptidase/acylaminoacyl peptidase